MTTLQLMILRVCCLTICRLPWGSRLLRHILVRLVVKGQGRDAYAASGGFFDWTELSASKRRNSYE